MQRRSSQTSQKLHTFQEVKEKFFLYISSPEARAKVEEAYKFAEAAHKGQMRKSGEPYIHHLIEVCYILADIGCGPSTLIAGLLHDVVEDTDVSLETIKEKLSTDFIDYKNRHTIFKETSNLRDILFAKAFANRDDFVEFKFKE